MVSRKRPCAIPGKSLRPRRQRYPEGPSETPPRFKECRTSGEMEDLQTPHTKFLVAGNVHLRRQICSRMRSLSAEQEFPAETARAPTAKRSPQSTMGHSFLRFYRTPPGVEGIYGNNGSRRPIHENGALYTLHRQRASAKHPI